MVEVTEIQSNGQTLTTSLPTILDTVLVELVDEPYPAFFEEIHACVHQQDR